jgi:hypothetical protein
MTTPAYPTPAFPTSPPMPVMASPPPAPLGWAVWSGIALLVVALALVVTAAVGGISALVALFGSTTSLQGPADVRLHLQPGTYVVIPQTHAGSSVGRTALGLSPATVQVRAPDGGAVTVRPAAARDILNGMSAAEPVAFDVTAAGWYRVAVDIETDALVWPSVPTIEHRVGGWAGVGGSGAVLGATGLVLLIVGLVRRSKVKRALQPWPGPGGWTAPVPWQPWQPPPPGWAAPPPGWAAPVPSRGAIPTWPPPPPSWAPSPPSPWPPPPPTGPPPAAGR